MWKIEPRKVGRVTNQSETGLLAVSPTTFNPHNSVQAWDLLVLSTISRITASITKIATPFSSFFFFFSAYCEHSSYRYLAVRIPSPVLSLYEAWGTRSDIEILGSPFTVHPLVHKQVMHNIRKHHKSLHRRYEQHGSISSAPCTPEIPGQPRVSFRPW